MYLNNAELHEEIKRNKVTPDDVVRLLGDYDEALGPGVGTSVCALCNDFCREKMGAWQGYDEGDDHFEERFYARELLLEYKVDCSDKKWNELTTLERRFRHIVDVNEGVKENDVERYFISAHGLQSKLNGKWIWWTDAEETRRGLSRARFFVCKDCAKSSTGSKRWLVNSDPGRIPDHLKKVPLNIAEAIVLNEHVIFNKVVMLNVVKKRHLSGHVISIEINRRDNQTAASLPRREYSNYIKLAFFGEAGMHTIAYDQMRKENWDVITVRPEVVEMWMEDLEMSVALGHFKEHREEYIRIWNEQAQSIRDDAIDTDDTIACAMRDRSVSDVAQARPQFASDEDDVRHGDAAPGISHVLVRHADVESKNHHYLKSIQKVLTKEKKKVLQETESRGEEFQEEKLTLENDLPNEFFNNDTIIYSSFRHLLPLGHKSNIIGTGSVPEVVSRRLMRFNDPRFARDENFRNYLFSQHLRHGMCRRLAKLRSGDKLDGLRKMLKEPNFDSNLKYHCINEHRANLPKGKEFLNRLMPFFTDTTNAQKWSTSERKGSKNDMFGLMLTYGAGGFTVSPAMKDQRFAMRMMQRLRVQSGTNTWNPANFPDGNQRAKLSAENPVECARVYNILTRTFYSKLVCGGLSNGRGGYRSSRVMKELKEKGAFGHTLAVYGVSETQHNGSLHTHGIGFLPVLGMGLRQFAGLKEKSKQYTSYETVGPQYSKLNDVYETIDSHISATMPSAKRDRYRNKDKKTKKKYWIEEVTPVKKDDETNEDFYKRVCKDSDRINATLNYHETCKPSNCLSKKKRSKEKGGGKCRFGVLKRGTDGGTKCSQIIEDEELGVVVARDDFEPPPQNKEHWPVPLYNRILLYI